MIHAYSEKYLADAMRNLGEAFDFAHTVGRLELDNFLPCLSILVLQNFLAAVVPSMLQDFPEQNLPWK